MSLYWYTFRVMFDDYVVPGRFEITVETYYPEWVFIQWVKGVFFDMYLDVTIFNIKKKIYKGDPTLELNKLTVVPNYARFL